MRLIRIAMTCAAGLLVGACGHSDQGFILTGGPPLVVSVLDAATGTAICDAQVSYLSEGATMWVPLRGCPYSGGLVGVSDIRVEKAGYVSQTVKGVLATQTSGMPAHINAAHVLVTLVAE